MPSVDFLDLDTNEHLILNHLFHYYLFSKCTSTIQEQQITVNHLLVYIKSMQDTEKKLCENGAERRKKFNKKWKNVLIN